MKMLYQQISSLDELCGQHTISLLCLNRILTRQPKAIITHRSSTTYPNVRLLHQIQEEVIQATARHEYFLANLNITLVKSIVEYPPPLLHDSERTLHILSNTLDVRREIPLWRCLVRSCKWTNCRRPTQVSIIGNEIHTLTQSNPTVCIIM